MFIIQSRVIQRIASERSCVFIGRVADYILREHPRHVNIFITANLDDRIRRIAQRRNVLPKAAQSIIEEADEERATYYNFYSSGTWGAADTYDLCVNSSLLGIDATVDFIAHFIEQLNFEK